MLQLLEKEISSNVRLGERIMLLEADMKRSVKLVNEYWDSIKHLNQDILDKDEYIKSLQESKKFYLDFMNDILEYGRKRTVFNAMGLNIKNYEMSYEIFEHYYGDIPPYEESIEDWRQQKHIKKQKGQDG